MRASFVESFVEGRVLLVLVEMLAPGFGVGLALKSVTDLASSHIPMDGGTRAAPARGAHLLLRKLVAGTH